ncbi:alcohol dehydrogenase catalytic domain-containing protein [Mycoplasmatota bacterium WC44]
MNETMKAFVYKKGGLTEYKEVPVPKVSDHRDVLLKVEIGAICTSDLECLAGHFDPYYVKDETVIGHEFAGEIIEKGEGITDFEVGDRVVVYPAITCGECSECKKGNPAQCTTGGLYGIIGGIDGAQAEYVLLKYADATMHIIPDELSYEDVILVPDMVSTGYAALNYASVKKDDKLVILGLGPVGLCASILAKSFFGVEKVIAIDYNQMRCDLLEEQKVVDHVLCVTSTEDAIEKVMELTNGNMASAVADCTGVQVGLQSASKLAGFQSRLSTIAPFAGDVTIPFNDYFMKQITFRTGLTNGAEIPEVIEAIKNGKLDFKFILTHQGTLDDIEEGYRMFSTKEDGCVKWTYTGLSY